MCARTVARGGNSAIAATAAHGARICVGCRRRQGQDGRRTPPAIVKDSGGARRAEGTTSIHQGKYEAALADARAVAATGQGGPNSVLAVRSIEEYLAASKACAAPLRRAPTRRALTRPPSRRRCKPGHTNAHVTLLCNLTPKELRAWRAPVPSVYPQK